MFSPAVASARQLSQLRADTRLLVSDTGSAAVRLRFTDAQVDAFLNECQRDAVAQALPITSGLTLELVIGTTYYSMPTDFLAIRRVTWKNRVLEERSPIRLDQTKEWETISGSPIAYFVSFASRTLLGIYPYPADSTSTGTVKVEFYAQASDLSADSDQPFENIREFYPMHHALSYCAAARLAAIDGQVDLAPLYLQIAASGFARLGELATARPSYSPQISPSRGGGP